MVKQFTHTSYLALGLLMILSVGCESGRFMGGSKSSPEPTRKKEQPREENQEQGATQQEQQTGPQTQYQNPGGEEEQQSSNQTQNPQTTPSVTPQVTPAETTPEVAPQTAQPAVQPVAPITVASGGIHLPVIGIINMDSKYQLTNEGTRLVLSDSSRGVIASGKVSLLAVMDGQPLDAQGSAYGRPFLLKIKPEFLHADITSGALTGNQTVKLSVCQPENLATEFNQSVQCKNLNQYLGHSNGINTMVDLTASITIGAGSSGLNLAEGEGNTISINSISGAKDHGGCGTSKYPCVALTHPINNFAAKSGEMQNDNASPLVLDLNKNGKLDLGTVWVKKPVRFDLTGSGKAMRTGWVNKQDALLVLDHNNDGLINSGKELFGEYSHCVIKKCESYKKFSDGYTALEQYDTNNDYRIDAKDKVYAKLKVWRDLNQDGVSQKRELSSLAAAKVKSISLNYKALNKGDAGHKVADNTVKYLGSYTSTSGKIHKVGDVWFEIRQHKSLKEIVLAGQNISRGK